MFCTQCGQQNPDDSRCCARSAAAVSSPAGSGGSSSGPGSSAATDTTSTISLSAIEGALTSGEASGADPVLDETPAAGTALLVVKRGPNAGSRFLLDASAYQALLP